MKKINVDTFYDDALSNSFQIIASYENEAELRKTYGDQIFESMKKGVEEYAEACFRMGDDNHHLDFIEFIDVPDDTPDMSFVWDEE